jgi:hypothetical protein
MDCRCEPSSPCRRSCHRCRGIVRGFACSCQSTSFRNAIPRKPGPAAPVYEWRKVTNNLDKPKEWPTIVGPIRFAPDDVDLRSDEPARREAQRISYEQTLHAQGLTSKRCACSDCCCWHVTQGRTGDDVSLCHCKDCKGGYVWRHEIGKRPEKPKDSTSSFERALDKIIKDYDMKPAELGFIEKSKPPVSVPDTCADGAKLPEWFKDNLEDTLEALRISRESKPSPIIWGPAADGKYHELPQPAQDTKDMYSAFNAMPRKSYDDPVFDWKPLMSKADQEFARYANEITERIMKVYEITPAELGVTERTAEQRREKHTSDVIELYKNGLISADEAARYLGNRATPDAIFVSSKDAERIMKLYEPTSNTKENPMPISNSTNPVTDLANRARELAKDGNVSLDAVKGAIDNGKAEYKARVEKALEGAAELEVLKGAQGKQFFVKHFCRNEVHTTYGIAYPGYDVTDEDEESELSAYTIRLQDDRDPILYSKYRTMGRLRKALDERGVPYVVKFYE